MVFELVFDDVILKQLRKAAKNQHVRVILKTMLDKIEAVGPNAGDLLDSKLFLYEMKSKHPPIRLYFKHKKESNEMYILEFETSEIANRNPSASARGKMAISESAQEHVLRFSAAVLDMKTSERKQQRVIDRLRYKLRRN